MKMKVVSLSLPIRRILLLTFTFCIALINAYSQKGLVNNKDSAIAFLVKKGMDKAEAAVIINMNLQAAVAKKQAIKNNIAPSSSPVAISTSCGDLTGWSYYSIENNSVGLNSSNTFTIISPIIGTSPVSLVYNNLNMSSILPMNYCNGCNINWGIMTPANRCGTQIGTATPQNVLELGFNDKPNTSPGTGLYTTCKTGQLIRKTFNVDVPNCIFKFQNSIVNGGCDAFFAARVLNSTGSTVLINQVTDCTTGMGSAPMFANWASLVQQCPNMPPLCPPIPQTCPPNIYHQKMFSQQSLDLSAYYGQTVIIELVNSVCPSAQHLSYSLVGGFCYCSGCNTSCTSTLQVSLAPFNQTLTCNTNTVTQLTCNKTYNLNATLNCINNNTTDFQIIKKITLFDLNGNIPTWANALTITNNSLTIPVNVSGSYNIRTYWGSQDGASICDSCTYPIQINCTPTCNLTTTTINETCTAKNGKATVIATAGVPPYTFTWPGVPATQIANNATSSVASGLSAGSYSLMVTDANGCIKNTSVVVGNTSSTLTLTAIFSNQICAAINGSITASASNGTAPFQYTIDGTNFQSTPTFTGLVAGNYTITVKDANGCTKTTTVCVGNSQADFSLSPSSVNAACSGSNGSATVAVTGNTGPYTYYWNTTPVQTTPTISSLPSGNYTVIVTDANGCTKTTTACVGNSESDFSLSPSSITDYCGKGNGSGTVSVIGNSGPYSYVWNTTPVKTTPTITGLLSGNYTVTVTDAFGCSKIAAISVGNSQSSLNLNTSSSPENCNQHNGVAAVTASGGTAPYTYSWNTTPIKTTAAISGLSQGNYTVTVTDANNCSSVKNITINNLTAPLLTETHLNTNCNKSNGSIDLSVTGGIAPYTYSWSFGAGSQDVSNLTAGSYQVTVTDAGGCTATKNILIANLAGPVLTETHINITCGNPNGSIDLSVNGGTIPYTYLWSNGATSQDLNSITTPGTYSVVVIDANCCSATKTISISNTPCPDCCEGGSWTSKTIGWSNIINGNLMDLSTQKAIAKIPGLDLSSYTGPATGLSNSINITKCDSTYHVSQNGTYTLDGTYSCNPNLSGCIKDMKVKIDGPAHSGIYTSPVTQTFSIPGNYQIAYYAYCGGKLCDSCKFTLAVDINCCAGNSWVSKTYTKVNLDYSSSAPATLLGVFDNPVGLKPIIYAPKAVNVILNYACPSGCGNATYKLLQKNNITGAIIVNTIITGNIASVYTYAATSRVWVTPMCGGRTCGQPLIFDIKCNAPVCPAIISWPLPWSIGTTNIYDNTPLLGLKEIEEKLFPIATKNAAITQATISYNGGEYLLNVIYANKEGQKNDEIIIPLKIDDTGLLEMGEFFIRKNNDATNITTRIPDTSISANYKKNPFYVGHMALLK